MPIKQGSVNRVFLYGYQMVILLSSVAIVLGQKRLCAKYLRVLVKKAGNRESRSRVSLFVSDVCQPRCLKRLLTMAAKKRFA